MRGFDYSFSTVSSAPVQRQKIRLTANCPFRISKVSLIPDPQPDPNEVEIVVGSLDEDLAQMRIYKRTADNQLKKEYIHELDSPITDIGWVRIVKECSCIIF